MSKHNQYRMGYKETKMGWLPCSWNCVPLGDIALVQTGLAKGRNDLRDPVTRPYLRVANVQDGFLKLDEIKEIAVEKDEVDRFLLRPGDVLFTEGGDFDKLGRGTIWKGEIPGCLHQNHVFAVRCNEGSILPDFLAAVATSSNGRRYFILSSKQSTNLASINSTQLRAFPVPLPPLREQKKITEILSTWIKCVEQKRKFVEVKRHRKKALMQQLLTGKKRLHGSTVSWKEYRLGDLFSERDEINNARLPLLAITASRGVILANEIDRKDASAQDKSSYKRIAPGDIGYNTMRMWQGVSAVSILEGIVSPAYTVCVPNASVDVRFMGYLFKFPPVVHSFYRHSQGLVSDTWNLKFPHFAQIKVRIPAVDEQHRIAEVLSTVDHEIGGLEEGLEAIERQKRGLMQKLLTGEVRVKV